MGSVWLRDLAAAFRSARRRIGFSLAVAVTLAMAIGANTAMFTIVHTVLLRRLPFSHADRLFTVSSREPGSDRQPFSIPDFLDLKRENVSFDTLIGWGSGSVNLTGVDEPIALRAQWTTRGFFSDLGVRAALGRTPLPQEEQAGAPRVILLGDALWRSRFGADPAVLGKSLTLNGEPYTVIGVLPRDFVFVATNVDLAGPLVLETDPRRLSRGSGFLRVIGRLHQETSPAAARADLDAIVARAQAAYPETNANKQGVRIDPLEELVVGGYRRILLVLQAAVGAVLLIACSNLANLLLVRVASRRPEWALRVALGARRRDLIRQVLAETTMLALAGGALGLLLALAGVRALLLLAPTPLPRASEIGVDAQTLLFNLGLSLLTGIALGLVPALQGSRGLGQAVRASGRGQTEGLQSARMRNALVAAEVGLSLVLLVGAGLLLRTLARLQATDPGFRTDHLLAVQLSLPKRRYGNPEAIARYAGDVTDRLAGLPGVTRAAATSLNPLTQWKASVSFTIEGRADLDPKHAPLANYRAVGAGYFQTLEVPLVAGREIDSRDRADSLPVAVIGQTLAQRHFPNASPLGARLRIDDREPWRAVEVIGVVGDVKFTGLDAQGAEDIYVPYAQTPQSVSVWLANIFCVAVRTHRDPRQLAVAVRREIHSVDRDVAIASIRTMSEAFGSSLAERRFQTLLLEIFGGIAFALALAGIYAVTAFGVLERTREIGVRLSLGCGPSQILKLIVGQALVPVAVGVLAGSLVAVGATRLLARLLFGVAPHDPATLAVAAFGVGFAAFLASAVPAVRAMRIDPVRALRAD